MLGIILAVVAVVLIIIALAYMVRVGNRRRAFDSPDPTAASASLDAQARTLHNGLNGRGGPGGGGFYPGH